MLLCWQGTRQGMWQQPSDTTKSAAAPAQSLVLNVCRALSQHSGS